MKYNDTKILTPANCPAIRKKIPTGEYHRIRVTIFIVRKFIASITWIFKKFMITDTFIEALQLQSKFFLGMERNDVKTIEGFPIT